MSPQSLFALLKKHRWSLIILLVVVGTIPFALRFQSRSNAPDKTPTSLQAPTSTFPTPIPATYEGILRLTIREPGMYHLTHQDLTTYGLDAIPPTEFRLFNLGVPQPLWFSGNAETLQLYFYGHPLDSPYTLDNVYFLTTQTTNLPSSIQLPDFNPSVINPSYPPPLHLEENTLYLPKAEPNHTWFWENLTAPKTTAFEFSLPQLTTDDVTLRVSLFASTEAENISPDHHLLIRLNDTLIAEQSWDGRGAQTFEQKIVSATLHEGTNSLSLELPGDTGAIVETILLDWIEIQFVQPINGENGRAGFRGTGEVVALTSFRTPPLVFDLSLAGSTPPIEIHPSANSQTPTELDHLYLAIASDASPSNGFLIPLSITPAQLSPDLRNLQGNYLAIGPPDLLEPLQPLLTYRASQSLTPLSIPVTAIYDQFGGGIAHPEAIRSFLQYAFQTWDSPPKYVVLVGDSTYDPRGYQANPDANRLPSFFRYTFFGGETISDTAFAQLDDDNLPDLIVGRIPARTAEQVSIIVEKTLAYEQTPKTSSNRILAIADGQDQSFQTDAQLFLERFPKSYTPLLLSPPKGDTTVPGQISETLNEGVLFMSYFGHGSITMLGKDRLFSVEDSLGLTNKDTLPIMINSTCLAGLFTHPETESLTETMLWNRDGGAVAALSATSLTVPSDQAYLTNAFVDAFIKNPDASLGELLLLAQRQIPSDQEGVREVMDTFLLFGDPALQIP